MDCLLAKEEPNKRWKQKKYCMKALCIKFNLCPHLL